MSERNYIARADLGNNRTIVLCDLGGEHHPFVTWAAKTDSVQTDTFWGHYFEDRQAAFDDFCARVLRGY